MADVLFYPGSTTNPYTGMIAEGLRRRGRQVGAWTPSLFGGRANILHIHWPEAIGMGRFARRSEQVTDLLFRQLLSDMRRIRREGGRTVWTAHNVRPHERPAGTRGALMDRRLREVYDAVDVVISLSEAGAEEIRAAYPDLAARFAVIPHQHYEGIYPAGDGAGLRARLGIPADAGVIAMTGRIRPYKGILEAIRAFTEVGKPDEHLLIAGDCVDADLLERIRAAVAATPRTTLLLKDLTDQEFADVHAAAGVILCYQRGLLNSGSVLAALSMARPVIAPSSGAIPELARRVGPGWCQLLDPSFPHEQLRAALDRLRTRQEGKPDLSAHDPERVIDLHLQAYFGDAAAASPSASLIGEAA